MALTFLIIKTWRKINYAELGDYFYVHFCCADFILPLLILTFGSLLNWAMESIKWYLVLKRKETFMNSYASVLCGLGISIFLPNRGGEFIGRVMYLQDKHKIKNSILSVITSYSQQVITVAAGLASVYFLNSQYHLISVWIFNSIFILGVVFCLIYLFIPSLLSIQWFQKFFVHDVPSYRTLTTLLCISMFRFLVFLFQYYYIYIILDVSEIPGLMTVIQVLCVQFVITSYMPGFILTEIGIKTGIGVYLFGIIGIPALPVVAATVIIWIINIVLPALIGIILIAKLKVPEEVE